MSESQRELLDAESVTGHLLSAGSVFAFLAAHRLALFPASMFTDLFPTGRGRPSIPPDVVASVLVLQSLHGLSDRQAAEAVLFDLRWKAACGLAITDTSFHPTTLTYWRKRLAASDAPNRIFDAVKAVIVATGVLRGKTRRALDSTVLDDAVATQDTVTQLVAAIRRVAREVPGGAEAVTALRSTVNYVRPGKPDIAWDDQAARHELVDTLVRDALAVLTALTSTDTSNDSSGGPEQSGEVDAPGGSGDGGDDGDDGGNAAGPPSTAEQALALLALIAGQDVEWIEDPNAPGGGWWQIARQVAHDRVISTVDPDTRHAHKTRERRHDGFKAHVVAEPDTGIITAVSLTKASGPGTGDAAAGAALLATDDTFTAPGEVLADSAYGTGEMLADLAEAGHEAVIKPWPIRPAVPDGFSIDDFSVDHKQQSVTCPAGVTAGFTAKTRIAKFGTNCASCPFLDLCTTSPQGRSVTVNVHHQLQRAHRARWRHDEQLRADYRAHRPMIERTIAWITTRFRKVRYLGVTKNDAALQLRATAVNLRQLTAQGLAPSTTGWALTG